MTVSWDSSAAYKKIEKAAQIAVVRGTEDIHSTATKKILEGPATGKTYRRRGVEHQASAPGEAPMSDTGALAQNSGTEYSGNGLTGMAKWREVYAARLEMGFVGTDAAGRSYAMEPRPFALPTLVEREGAVKGYFADEIKAALV